MAKLKEMVEERDRLFRENGCFTKELAQKTIDPLKYELTFSKMMESVLSAREVGRLVSSSPAVREVGECVFAIFTPEGFPVCLSVGIQIHVYTMGRTIRWMIENDYEEAPGIKEGDHFFNNDPHIGTAHAPDAMVMTPIFYGDELVGWAGGLTHIMETGATEPGGMPVGATTRFEDGLILPCIKIAENDELKRDLEILVARNVRVADYWLTDNRAKMTGIIQIRQAVRNLIDEVGLDYYKQVIYEYIEDSRRATQAKTRQVLFPGRYRAVAVMDMATKGQTQKGQDRLFHIPLEMTVSRDGRIKFDFEGVSPQGNHNHNVTEPSWIGNLFAVLIQHCFNDIVYNHGTVAAFEFVVPRGTVANPDNILLASSGWSPGIAASGCWDTCLSHAAYIKGYRELILAPNNMSTLPAVGGMRNQYGRPYTVLIFELAASGQGAGALMDGLDCAYATWNPEADGGDAEIWEASQPLIYLGRRINIDGGGFGKYRGGAGWNSIFVVANVDETEVGMSFTGSCNTYPAPGIMGGYPASANHLYVLRDTNVEELRKKGAELPSKTGVGRTPEWLNLVKGNLEIWKVDYVPKMLKKGDIYEYVTLGGGGYGDPIERDPKLVLEDLKNELTSMRTARNIYGVAINPETWEIDYDETEKLRKEIREKRKKRGIPAKEFYEKERNKIISGNLPELTKEMYKGVFSVSEKFANEFKKFWNLPDEFAF